MSNKIRKEDLFEDNLFPTKEAEQYATQVDAIVLAQEKLIRQKMESAQAISFSDSKNSKNIADFIRLEKEANVAISQHTKALQEQEKLKQQSIKTTILQEKRQRELNKSINDSEKRFAALNKESEKANAEMQKQIGTLGRLRDENKKLTKERDLLNLSTDNGRKRLTEINLQLDKNNDFIKENTDALGKQKINVGNYIGDLRKMQKELAALEPGTKQFNELAQKTGALKDKINDAASATKAFASASKLTQAKNLFSQIGGDIADLNFQGAADKAKQFASVIKSISFAEVIGGIKNLGSAFLELGKSLLLNPFIAVTAAIVAVGAAIYQTYESFQFASKIQEEYNDILGKNKERIDDLVKSTRDLKVENDALAGSISENEKKRILEGNKFKDEYLKIKQDEREKIKELNKKFDDENKRTATESALLGALGSDALFQTRLAQNLKVQSKIILKIQADSQNEISKLGDNYREKIRGFQIEEVNGEKEKSIKKVEINKKEIETKIFDWEAYYDELDTLSANNNEDELQRLIELENIRFEQANRSATERYKNEVERKKILEQLEIQHQKNIEKILKDSNNEAKIAKGVLDEDDFKKRQKELQDEADYRKKEIRRIENELFDVAKYSIDKKQEANNEAIDAEIAARERSIETQQRLAEKGAENTLAFEQEQLAKAQLAKKQEAERQRRQDEAIKLAELFLNSLNGKLDKGDSYLKAAGEALAETFAAKGLASIVAGSAYEGVEDTGDAGDADSKGGKLWVLHPNERVLTKEQNKMIGGMSNDDLANLAFQSRMGDMQINDFGQNMSNSIIIHQLVNMNKGVKELNDIIKNKPVQQVAVDSFGNIIETMHKNNEKIVTVFMNKNRRKQL